MKQDSNILLQFRKTIDLAHKSKFYRLQNSPIKYLFALVSRYVLFRFFNSQIKISANTFFNRKLKVLLPAGTDIYLTGGKSHESELKLTSFLLRELPQAKCFIDVGAHFGFFTLLASRIMGGDCKIIAFEASKENYKILHENCSILNNVTLVNKFVGDTNETITFSEFPILYSEYNTAFVEQFHDTSWYRKEKVRSILVESISLNDYLVINNDVPDYIKIDVEGSEYIVIKGMSKFLEYYSPTIIMEFLGADRSNNQHILAQEKLFSYGFKSYLINSEGMIEECTDIETYLKAHNVDSENVIFRKSI